MTDIEECKNFHYLEDAIPTPFKMRKSAADIFDNLGRNITQQEKRQNMVPWIRVKYLNGRLKIPMISRLNLLK
jgi:hypothetical protein